MIEPRSLRQLFNGRLTAALLAMMVCAAAFVGAFPVKAQPQAEAEAGWVALPQGNNHLQPFQTLSYLILENDTLDPEEALSNRDAFVPLTSPWVDFGDQQGAIWLLVSVENAGSRPGEWMIDIQRPFVDELLVQKRVAGSPPETLLDVDRTTPFDARLVVSQYLVAPLWMEAGERAEILVGLRSSTGSWMPLTFATAERMRTAHMQEARFNWIINGAMFSLIVIALAMGRLVGWPLVLAFAAYAGLSALFVANNEGYLHRFVWPENMGAYEPANLLLLVGMMIAILQFARLFAGLAKSRPKANRLVKALQFVLVALAVLSAFLWHHDAMRWVVFAHVPLVAFAYSATAVVAWRDRVLGAIPFLAGSLAILFTVAVMSAVLLAPGRYPMTVALDYFHATVLFESLAFLIAILVRMLAIQKQLNRSLQAEVAASREKLELAEALQESRVRYDQARSHAEGLKARLASTSHDLQQPLLSLRRGLENVVSSDPEAARNLQAALTYLEGVTQSGLSHHAPDNRLAGEKPDDGVETFAANLVLENCAAMFNSEAKAAGVVLLTRSADVQITTEPIELMRAVSNLVSNSLKHARATKILIAVQPRSDHVLFRVIDNGCGMDDELLGNLRKVHAKGKDSQGYGLGLNLVEQFGERKSHGWAIRSASGRGTCAILRIPRA